MVMHVRVLVLTLLSSAALVAGCEDPSGPDWSDVSFTLSASSWAPGDTVHGSLRNAGEREAIYNFCGTSLDGWRESDWVEVAASVSSPTGVCAAIAFTLRPGESAEFAWGIPDTLSAGRYRLRTGVSLLSGDRYADRWVTTGPFTVTP